ncbi:hypothetical protein MKW94_014697 [Papaver nudicaule]|uniref:Uncharacterized protein n=1 Tax=Papaver nudicaule TaxID=74823 RepID=A0AA41V591_PAPNU|nr:hypothetical protein [Papaver nudicaule]
MAKTSSLVISFFCVMLVLVLQSAYAADSDAGSPSSPDIGLCDPRRMVEIGKFSDCDRCSPACFRSSFSASTCANSTNIGEYVCKCCAPFSPPSGTAATTTSLVFHSFTLFFSFMLNRLFA